MGFILKILDLDGTLLENSNEIYEDIFGKCKDLDEYISKFLEKFKNKDIEDVILLLSKYEIKLRDSLIENLKKDKSKKFLISDNPFVYQILDYIGLKEIDFNEIYSTTKIVTNGNKIVYIDKVTNKKNVFRQIVKKFNDKEIECIEIHCDNNPNDEELINYIEARYKEVKIFRY